MKGQNGGYMEERRTVLDRERSALLVVDVQERLWTAMRRRQRLAERIVVAVRGCRLLKIPILYTDQYPRGLGPTIAPLREALGDKKNINRYGDAKVPMDEALSQVSLDISGRPYLVFDAPPLQGKVGDFDLELVEEFFQAVTANSAVTLHITVVSGKNLHHIIESVFKAFARALDGATQLDPRGAGIPSTKGTL